MDTENKVQDKPPVANTAAQKASEPTFDNGPSIVGRKDRKTGWILAIVLLLIVAAGGVGFGVWAYMDSNMKKEELNTEIIALKEQNNTLQNDNATLKENADTCQSVMSRNSSVTTVEIDETKSLDRDGAKAEIIDGRFYVKDSKDEEIIHDDAVSVTDILGCKSESTGDSMSLVCEVSTPYGQGKFVYTYGQGYDVLNYTLDSWSDGVSDNVKLEETSEGVYELESK